MHDVVGYPFCSERVSALSMEKKNPFPPIGDAAYRQCAGAGPSRGHGQHAQQIW